LSFSGDLGGKTLNKAPFTPIDHSRMAIRLILTGYSPACPHSQIVSQTPDYFARAFTPRQSLPLG